MKSVESLAVYGAAVLRVTIVPLAASAALLVLLGLVLRGRAQQSVLALAGLAALLSLAAFALYLPNSA